MGLLDFPKRSGFLFSHKSLTLLDGADQFAGVLAWKANPMVDGRAIQYGTGPIGLGRSRGNLKIEVEAKFSAATYYDFVSKNPTYLFQEFGWTAVFEEGDQRATIECVQLAFDKTDAPSEGTEPNAATISGECLDLKINGVSVADSDALGALFGFDFSSIPGLGSLGF
jgi:hypothetical protein